MDNSPIKQNASLIQGAGTAAGGRTGGFVDVSGAFMKGATQPMTQLQMMNMRRKMYDRRRNEIELKNYVNSLEDIDLAKVEDSMRDEVSSFLIQNRNRYAEAAKIASRTDADNPEYMDAVREMNKIKSSFKNLSSNLDTFKKNREQFYEDVKNNSISDASNVDALNALYKNNDYDIVIDPFGSFSIFTEGEYVPLSDFTEDTDYNYHLKNSEGFNAIMDLTNKVHKAGVKLEGGARDIVSRNLSVLFNNMGQEDLMSMVYDNMLDSKIPIIDRDDFNDDLLSIENEDQLRTYLHDVFLEGLEAVGESSFNTNSVSSKKKKRRSSGGGSSNFNKYKGKNPEQIRGLLTGGAITPAEAQELLNFYNNKDNENESVIELEVDENGNPIDTEFQDNDEANASVINSGVSFSDDVDRSSLNRITVAGSSGSNRANILRDGKAITSKKSGITVTGVRAQGNDVVVDAKFLGMSKTGDLGRFKKSGDGFKFAPGSDYAQLNKSPQDKRDFDNFVRAVETDPRFAAEVLKAVRGTNDFKAATYG